MPCRLRGLLPSRAVPTLLEGVRRSDTRFSGTFSPRRPMGQRDFAIVERVFHCHAVFVGIRTRRLERVVPCHWRLIGKNTECSCLSMPPIAKSESLRGHLGPAQFQRAAPMDARTWLWRWELRGPPWSPPKNGTALWSQFAARPRLGLCLGGIVEPD